MKNTGKEWSKIVRFAPGFRIYTVPSERADTYMYTLYTSREAISLLAYGFLGRNLQYRRHFLGAGGGGGEG